MTTSHTHFSSLPCVGDITSRKTENGYKEIECSSVLFHRQRWKTTERCTMCDKNVSPICDSCNLFKHKSDKMLNRNNGEEASSKLSVSPAVLRKHCWRDFKKTNDIWVEVISYVQYDCYMMYSELIPLPLFIFTCPSPITSSQSRFKARHYR